MLQTLFVSFVLQDQSENRLVYDLLRRGSLTLDLTYKYTMAYFIMWKWNQEVLKPIDSFRERSVGLKPDWVDITFSPGLVGRQHPFEKIVSQEKQQINIRTVPWHLGTLFSLSILYTKCMQTASIARNTVVDRYYSNHCLSTPLL